MGGAHLAAHLMTKRRVLPEFFLQLPIYNEPVSCDLTALAAGRVAALDWPRETSSRIQIRDDSDSRIRRLDLTR